MKRFLIVFGALIIAACGVLFFFRGSIRSYFVETQRVQERATLPPAQPYVASPSPNNDNRNTTPVKNLNVPKNIGVEAASMNLAIPFVSQAPFKVWDAFHEDACEEAAMLMVDHYFSGKPIGGLRAADDELHAIVDWETSTHGYGLSITAEEAATVLRGFFGYKTIELKVNPTVADMKGYLNEKLPIIVPASGKLLENPNFTNGGPVYHMLVIKGYTADGKWITNDPGTRLGADFLYQEQNLMEAMHDWNGGDVPHGRKVIIIVHPN